MLLGYLMSFKSIDTVIRSRKFPTKFFNSLDIPGILLHNLRLNIGSPIILLRNLKPPILYNGRYLVIKRITGNIIEATILTAKFKGEIVILPSDTTIAFKRLQFPIHLALAMTQQVSRPDNVHLQLKLKISSFSHKQLYVTCSLVSKPSNLFILAKDRLTKYSVHQIALN